MRNAPTWPRGTPLGAGRYRIEGEIGRGGAGTVFKAVHIELDDLVAIKVSSAVDTGSLEGLRDEARLLRGLRHTHLPQVLDFFVEGHWPCLVMEFIDGEDLNQLRVARGDTLSEAEALGWITHVADALAYLHLQPKPIIHRDIKPENIRVKRNGVAILVDFGIAKVGGVDTQTRLIAKGMGTPPYAPPEQYGSGNTSPSSDVYALGATCYVLLTGYSPPDSVDRQSGAGLIPPRQHNPQISRHTEQVILKAMALSSTERYPSAREMLEALKPGAPPKLYVDKTEVLPSRQTCPKCGAIQETPNPAFCIKCGVPIALRFQQSGRLVTVVADLVTACDVDWEAGVQHVQTGRLNRWLEARSETPLYERLLQAQAQYPGDPAAALELLLRPKAPHDLAADRAELDFGGQPAQSQPMLSLVLRVGALGYVHGTVQAVGNWLTVRPTMLSVRPGQPLPAIVVGVRPETMRASDLDQTYTGAVSVRTNRGSLEIPARLVVHNPPRPEVVSQLNLGVFDARQRVDQRVALRNAGGGVVTGQVSSRQPWLTVEAQQSRFALRRGEQHTVSFSVDTRRLSPAGAHEGDLLWETEQGDLLTRVRLEVTPPYELSSHDPIATIQRLEDLVRLCDCVRGGEPHAWERGLGHLRAGRLAAACRFFKREDLALEAEQLAHLADSNVGLEQLLRRLGARPAKSYKDNQGNVLSQITGPLSKKPAEVEYGILNTSRRGYLYGALRPLVEWINIPEPHFGCLPDQEAVIKLYPDYTRRAKLPLFGSVALFEIVLE